MSGATGSGLCELGLARAQRCKGKLCYEQGSEREKIFSLRPASKQNGVRAPVNGRAASHLRIQVGEQWHDDLPFASWMALQ